MRAEALSRLVFAERRVAPIRPDAERAVALPDGRRLGTAEFGLRAAVPLVYLHGFLGSRLEAGAVERLSANVIGLERPGYGRTDPQPVPSLAAFGRDVRDGLDAMGVDRCLIVGASTGAPYALAAALALGPERVPGLVLAAGIAAPEVLAGAGGAALAIDRLARRGPAGLGGAALLAWLRLARLTGLDRTMLGLVVAAEAASLRRVGIEPAAVHERMLQSLRAGNGRALRGPVADAALLTRPWDIDPAALAAETLVLHGTGDDVVPVAHARWYAERLPRARLELVAGERHLSLCFGSAAAVQRLALALATAD